MAVDVGGSQAPPLLRVELRPSADESGGRGGGRGGGCWRQIAEEEGRYLTLAGDVVSISVMGVEV